MAGSAPGPVSLVPVCSELLDAEAEVVEIRSDMDACELVRGIGGVGGICAGAGAAIRYDARRPVEILVAGLRRVH
ncbi:MULTISPECIES: hypothetical protein [unclassified Streptomyces]|uniref:hypothetical protein n=1 Tax=unclassified Streptomyces TaxID=2593676 RepID=UPI00386ABC5A